MAVDRYGDHDTGPSNRTGGPRRRSDLGFTPGRPITRISRRYSRFVGVTKVVLPLVATGIVGLLVLWPTLRETPQPMVEALELEAGMAQLVGPRLIGTDASDRPYTIVAEGASQSTDDPDIIELAAPQGEITLDNGAWMALTANTGRFDRARKRLHLSGDVFLYRDDGHQFSTDEAHIDMAAQTVWGDRPVIGVGPAGEIESEGFRIEDNGATVIFTGRSRAVLVDVGIARDDRETTAESEDVNP